MNNCVEFQVLSHLQCRCIRFCFTFVSASQLIAQADFRIDFGTHITNSLEAECDDVENVSDLQDEADLENEDNLEKQDFNIVSETQRSDLSGYQSKSLQNAWIN